MSDLYEMDILKKEKLTSCQTNALKTLAPLFEEESNARIGILTGSAGTGKTFMAAFLINKLEDEGWNVVVLTPTGRAAQVMADKMKPYGLESLPQTMHSYMYKINPIDYSASQLSIFGDIKTQTEEEKTIFIIDEGSMVGNEKKEQQSTGLNFGSGSLLHDFIECADLAFRDDSRVLIVGDPCQLPPISKNSNLTPALSVDSIRDSIPKSLQKTEILRADLKTILRQEEGTLLDFVTRVRDAITSGDSLPKKALEDVTSLRESNIVETYHKATSSSTKPEGAIILAHTNLKVSMYNKLIRKSLGRENDILTKNEILLVKRNVSFRDYGELDISNNFSSLKNGTFIQVTNTPYALKDRVVRLKGDEVVTLKFCKASIKFLNSEKEHHVTILANSLIDGNLTATAEERKNKALKIEIALMVDFHQRMLSQNGWKPQKPSDPYYEEYSKTAMSDKFLNALRVRYGYAVTVHNSQGGEWPVVIVDAASNFARDLQHIESMRASFARWVYTASTRASEKLYFING